MTKEKLREVLATKGQPKTRQALRELVDAAPDATLQDLLDAQRDVVVELRRIEVDVYAEE